LRKDDAVLKSNIEFRANAVGVVEEGIAEEGERQKGRYETVSRIRVFEEFADGLSGIREYSHVIVIWHMDREDEVRLKVKPRGSIDMPEVGIFATRFPPRPNHVGASVVELVSVSGSSLSVRGLDAWPGSPVLDIKPYSLKIIRITSGIVAKALRFRSASSLLRISPVSVRVILEVSPK